MAIDIKFLCCENTFSLRKSLYMHCRKFHYTDVLTQKDFKCDICQKSIYTTNTLSVYTSKISILNLIQSKQKENQTRINYPCDKPGISGVVDKLLIKYSLTVVYVLQVK